MPAFRLNSIRELRRARFRACKLSQDEGGLTSDPGFGSQN